MKPAGQDKEEAKAQRLAHTITALGREPWSAPSAACNGEPDQVGPMGSMCGQPRSHSRVLAALTRAGMCMSGCTVGHRLPCCGPEGGCQALIFSGQEGDQQEGDQDSRCRGPTHTQEPACTWCRGRCVCRGGLRWLAPSPVGGPVHCITVRGAGLGFRVKGAGAGFREKGAGAGFRVLLLLGRPAGLIHHRSQRKLCACPAMCSARNSGPVCAAACGRGGGGVLEGGCEHHAGRRSGSSSCG